MFDQFKQDLEKLYIERNVELSRSPRRIGGDPQPMDLKKVLDKAMQLIHDYFTNADQIMKIKQESEAQIQYIRKAHSRETQEISALVEEKECEKAELKQAYERDILNYKEKMAHQVNHIQGSMESNMQQNQDLQDTCMRLREELQAKNHNIMVMAQT